MPENGTFRDASASFRGVDFYVRVPPLQTKRQNCVQRYLHRLARCPARWWAMVGHLGQAEPGLSLIEVTQHAASQRATSDQVCSKVVAPKKSPRCVQATISVRI